MPIRQHPLVRYYARATQLISLASLAGNDFPSTEDVIEYFGMAVAALPPLEPGADRRHDEIRDALESVARGGKPEYVPFEVQARWAAGRLADHTAQLATRGEKFPRRSYLDPCFTVSRMASATRNATAWDTVASWRSPTLASLSS